MQIKYAGDLCEATFIKKLWKESVALLYAYFLCNVELWNVWPVKQLFPVQKTHIQVSSFSWMQH